MKKYLSLIAALLLTGVAFAMTPTYTSYLVNNVSLAVDSTYELDTNALHVDQLSFQATYSSATTTSADFNNGTVSTGAVTVATNSGFAAAKATDQITVTDNAAVASTNTITISSNSALTHAYLTINGYKLTEGIEWTKGSLSSNTATSIATAIRANVKGITASSVSNVVYATATTAGVVGNAYTMTSSTPAAMAVGGATFSGGLQPTLENAILTVNGKPYRNGYEWKSAGTNSGTATNLATFLGHISGIAASSVSNVVYATATTAGTAGNSFTLASSKAGLSVNSANFAGGLNNATVSINGTSVVYATDWTSGSTSSATAKAISDAIMASALNTIVSSTWNASAVVTITALTAGPNYSLESLPTASLTATGAHMTGGAVSGIDTTAETLTSANNGLSTGLGILFSTISASTPPAPLTNQTTYYAISVDANTFKLATSATNAVLGTAINLTTQGTANKTFRVTPLTITGTSSFKWQVSNDDANWVDLNVSSVTFGSPYTATTAYWDFGQVNSHYVRLKFVAPTTGGVNLKVKGNGKSNNP